MENRKANEARRFKENERVLSAALIADAVIFLLFLLFAGLGIGWLKVILTILAFAISALGMAVLYMTGELPRRRSRYLAAGFAAIVLCILVSLIAKYPSPFDLEKAVADLQQTASAFLHTL